MYNNDKNPKIISGFLSLEKSLLLYDTYLTLSECAFASGYTAKPEGKPFDRLHFRNWLRDSSFIYDAGTYRICIKNPPGRVDLNFLISWN